MYAIHKEMTMVKSLERNLPHKVADIGLAEAVAGRRIAGVFA
jgi:hypothetical protein